MLNLHLVPSKPSKRSVIISDKQTYEGFESTDCRFLRSGRYALLAAIREIGLRPDDFVLVPALYCETTLTMLRASGINLKFCDVDEQLNFYEPDLEELLETHRIGASIIVNYFGMNSPNHKQNLFLLRQKKIPIIADFCHSICSIAGLNLHDYDFVISSLNKTVPTYYGGLLLRKKKQHNSWSHYLVKKDNKLDLARLAFETRSCLEGLILAARVNIYSSLFESIRSHTVYFLALFWRKIFSQKKMSPLVGKLLTLQGPFGEKNIKLLNKLVFDESISRVRCKNYLSLASCEFSRNPYFSVLNLKICVPQGFVIISHDEKLLGYLRNNGVGAYCWPGSDVPPEIIDFPIANSLSKRLLVIPIHQSIVTGQIVKIKNLLICYQG